MSNGTCCSASQKIASLASSGFILSMTIFFTITARPDTAVTTSFSVDARLRHALLDPLDDEAPVHDLALDDRLGRELDDAVVREDRLALRVIDLDDLDVARTDVQSDGCFRFPRQELHISHQPSITAYVRRAFRAAPPVIRDIRNEDFWALRPARRNKHARERPGRNPPQRVVRLEVIRWSGRRVNGAR